MFEPKFVPLEGRQRVLLYIGSKIGSNILMNQNSASKPTYERGKNKGDFFFSKNINMTGGIVLQIPDLYAINGSTIMDSIIVKFITFAEKTFSLRLHEPSLRNIQ